MRGGLFGALTLVILGAIAADVLTHPAGTQAAGTALTGVLRTSLQAASGQAVR